MRRFLAHTLFSDPQQRKMLMEKFFARATQALIMSDTRAFLDYLAAQPDVKPGRIGTTGYCVGGLMSLTAAGTYWTMDIKVGDLRYVVVFRK